MLPTPVGDPPDELLFAECEMTDEASCVVDEDSDVYSEELFDVYSDVYCDREAP